MQLIIVFKTKITYTTNIIIIIDIIKDTSVIKGEWNNAECKGTI